MGSLPMDSYIDSTRNRRCILEMTHEIPSQSWRSQFFTRTCGIEYCRCFLQIFSGNVISEKSPFRIGESNHRTSRIGPSFSITIVYQVAFSPSSPRIRARKLLQPCPHQSPHERSGYRSRPVPTLHRCLGATNRHGPWAKADLFGQILASGKEMP